LCYFQNSDAWILLSLVYSRRTKGVDLRTLIATADYINHAIPNESELRESLQRLMTARLTEAENFQYKVSARVVRQYNRTTTPRRTALKEVDDLQKFLDNVGQKEIQAKEVIDASEFSVRYREAVEHYLSASETR